MSGNHGSENPSPVEVATVSAPQRSTQAFVKPAVVIKPAVSIKEMAQNKTSSESDRSSQQEELHENVNELPEHIEKESETNQSAVFEKPELILADQWINMVEEVLFNVISIYNIMKNTTPILRENELVIPASNTLIKDQIEQQSRKIVAYFKPFLKIENLKLKVEIDQLDKVRTTVYDAKEKFDLMTEKNDQLRSFTNILNLQYEY